MYSNTYYLMLQFETKKQKAIKKIDLWTQRIMIL